MTQLRISKVDRHTDVTHSHTHTQLQVGRYRDVAHLLRESHTFPCVRVACRHASERCICMRQSHATACVRVMHLQASEPCNCMRESDASASVISHMSEASHMSETSHISEGGGVWCLVSFSECVVCSNECVMWCGECGVRVVSSWFQ